MEPFDEELPTKIDSDPLINRHPIRCDYDDRGGKCWNQATAVWYTKDEDGDSYRAYRCEAHPIDGTEWCVEEL